jgi:hypothetical protein
MAIDYSKMRWDDLVRQAQEDYGNLSHGGTRAGPGGGFIPFSDGDTFDPISSGKTIIGDTFAQTYLQDGTWNNPVFYLKDPNGEYGMGTRLSRNADGSVKTEQYKLDEHGLGAWAPFAMMAAPFAAAISAAGTAGAAGASAAGASGTAAGTGAAGAIEGAAGAAGGYSIPTAGELAAAGYDVGGMAMTGPGGIGAVESVAGAGAGAAGYGVPAAAGVAGVAEAGTAGEFGTGAGDAAASPSSFSDARFAAEYGIDPAYVGTGTAANSLSSFLSGAKDILGNPLVSVGTSLISGALANRAANKAADAQTAAAQAAIDEQRRQYDQTRTDLSPWRTRGVGASNRLAVMMGLAPDAASYGTADPKQDPFWMKGYQTVPKYQPQQQAQAQPQTQNAFTPIFGMKRG